jgi:hypothetical protein
MVARGVRPIKIQPLRDRHPQLGSFKQFRIAGYVFDPKLPHHSLHIIGPEATPIGTFVAELTHARDPRIWVARDTQLLNDTDLETVTGAASLP